jgi:hypothetical protein
MDGVPIGIINFADDGGVSWATYASNIALANTGIRTTIRRYVSTFALGIGDVVEERDDTVFLSWYYGYMFPLGDSARWWLTPELGYVHVMPQSSEAGKINNLHFDLQVLAKGEVRLGEIYKVFIGAGVNWQFSDYSKDAAIETDPMIMAGVSIW